MKRSIKVIAVLALAAGSVVAFGQTTTDSLVPSGVTIRIGGGFGVDESLNSYASGYYGAGLDFGFGRGLLPGAETYYSVDMLWGARESFNQSVIPLLIDQRFYTDKGGGDNSFGQTRLYFNLGLGATYYNIGGSDIKPSGKLGVGLEFTQTIIGEADLYLAQRSKDDVTANLLGFYVGYKF